MPVSKPQSALGVAALAAVFSVVWAVTAVAQQDAAPPAGKPSMTAPAPGAQASPEAPQTPRAVPPSETPVGHDLVGLSVFSSDGTRVGDVRAVNTGPGGTVATLHVKTGGFLGFGGRIVAIPGGAFARKGPDIRLNLSTEEVDNLPEVKEGR